MAEQMQQLAADPNAMVRRCYSIPLLEAPGFSA